MATMAVRLDQITAEARKLRFGRAFLTVAVAPCFALGWALGKGWLAVAFVIAAVRFGWREANAS